MPSQRVISLEELSTHFQLPEKMVAKKLGICLTSLKKLCRQHGIHRWPYRKLKSIEKKIEKLEALMRSPAEDINSVRAKIHALNEEKKRLPFTGTPSCAYGGVRRTSAHSSPSSLYDANMLNCASQSWSASNSPVSEESLSSPDGSISVASGHSRLAERLRAVGSIHTHKQRLAASRGMAMPEESIGASSFADSVLNDFSDASVSSGEDFAEQPDDSVEDGLMYGDIPGAPMFDVPAPSGDAFGGFNGLDMPSVSCGESAALEIADDFFANDPMATSAHDDFFSTTAF